MRVGILHVDLHIAGARSLKEKRKIFLSLKERLASRFNISIAEVGAQDLWQRAELGIALVALDGKSLHASIQKIEGFIRNHPGVTPLSLEKEIIG